MPIYEYECKDCGYVFERLILHLKNSTHRRCPNCGQLAKRIMSAGSFILKGAGFYKNDYGSGSVSESTVKEEKSEGKNEKAV